MYGHYRKIGRKIGQEREKNLICEGPPLKKSNGIKYITRQSPQILNTGTYRKIFRDFSLAQMGDFMGIFNRPSDFSLAVGDWASGSLYPCLDLQYSHTFMKSISCLYLPTFRSQASIVSEKSTVFTFSYRKALVSKFDLAVNEKRGNKQCLLDTPGRVTVNNKRLISIHIKSEKNMHIYKSHGIIENYKGKLL